MKIRYLFFTLLAGVALGAYAQHLAETPLASTPRQMLLTVPMPDMGDKEARMWVTELPPGAVTPKHHHPGHVVAYVLEGAIIHAVDGKEPVTLRAGQAWHEATEEMHLARNASATVPAKILAVQIADKGQPLGLPAN
jgi:quercetin dioxygenase-like cupin family protein